MNVSYVLGLYWAASDVFELINIVGTEQILVSLPQHSLKVYLLKRWVDGCMLNDGWWWVDNGWMMDGKGLDRGSIPPVAGDRVSVGIPLAGQKVAPLWDNYLGLQRAPG